MTYVWIGLLVLTAVVFVVLQAFVYPKVFFKFRYSVNTPTGRGVKVVRETNGRTIVYDGSYFLRKYIPQYLVSERDGKKQLVCKAGEGIRYLAYDVVVFDNFNTVIDVLHVKEVIGEKGQTAPLDLPAQTAFLSVYLSCANEATFRNKLAGGIPGARWVYYFLFCIFTDILAVFSVRACVAMLFGGLYGEYFLYSPVSIAVAGVVCVAVILLNAAIVPLIVRRRGRERRGERA